MSEKKDRGGVAIAAVLLALLSLMILLNSY